MGGLAAFAHPWARRLLPLLVLSGTLTVFGLHGVAGAGTPGPSDDRATFVPGNLNSCAEAGITASNVLSADPPVDKSDGNVSGDVSDYDGQDPPGTTPAADDATMLNVTVLNPDVVIRGVVVKGGNNSNVYSTNVQNMIAPLNSSERVPAISHWFVCYDLVAPPSPPAPPGGEGGAGEGTGPAGAPTAVRAEARLTG